MKTETAQSASYRVPTGTEIEIFAAMLNLAIKVGHKLTYCQSGIEKHVSGVTVSPCLGFLFIDFLGGGFNLRRVELLSGDSFAFATRETGTLCLCTPSWLGGDK